MPVSLMPFKIFVAVQKLLMILMLLSIVDCLVCHAQDLSSSDPPAEDTDTQVYLHDKDGQAVAVPRLDYQRFEDFLQRQYQATQAPDSIVQLKSISLNGVVQKQFVELDVTFVAEIKQDFASPLRIPIGLSKLVLGDFIPSGAVQSRISTLSPASPPAQSESDLDAELDPEDDSGLSPPQKQLFWEILPSAVNDSVADSGSSKECQIVLHGYLPIISDGRNKVDLDLPNVASILRIRLPKLSSGVDWTGGSNQKLDFKEVDEFIEWERVGQAESKLSWIDSAGNIEEKIATEVTSITRVQVNMEGRPWTVTSRISLKPSSVASNRELIVELPSGSTWIQIPDSASRSLWTVTKNSEPTDKFANSSSPIRLRLKSPSDQATLTGTTAEIRWNWQPPAKLDQDFQLQTIAVPNADRHEGTLELVMPSQIQFTWKSGQNGSLSRRLVESGTPDLFNYVFSFSKTPLDILCRLRESGYRLQYRPEYFAELKDESIELTGFLNFAVDPSLMVGLEINLGAWTLKDIRWAQSGQPIDYEQSEQGVVRFDPAGLYRRNEAASSATSPSGRTIQATLLRPLFSSNGSPVAQIDLPTVAWLNDQGQVITEVGNGWLVVATNEWLVGKPSIELLSLTPVDEIPTNLSNFMKPTEKNLRRAYLFSPQEKLPLWKAELKRKPNLATQSVNVRIDFDQSSYRVQKSWTVGQNKWTDLGFFLCVPENIAQDLVNDNPDVPAAQRASLTMDGKRVPCQRLATQAAVTTRQYVVEAATASEESLKETSDSTPTSAVKIPEGWTTIQPVLGEVPRDFVLKLEATADFPRSDSKQVPDDTPIKADIALPFLIASSPILPIERHFEAYVNSTWKANLKANGNELTILPGQYVQSKELSGTLTSLNATLEKLSFVKPSAVRINQIWLQTALNGSERRDRCVVDLTTASEQLELNLANADINNLTSVLVNGQRVDPQRIEGTTSLILMLPRPAASTSKKSTAANVSTKVVDGQFLLNGKPAPQPTRYTVELWIWSTVAQRLIYRIDENLPRIANAAEPAPKYWQVVVPQHDHLWTASESLIPEYQWTWSGFTLERTTQMQQSELEKLTRASEQAQFGLDANRYLFSSLATTMDGKMFGTAQHIYIVPRFVLFGPIGLIAILVSCLLVYFPSLRSIWMLGFGAIFSIGVAAVSVDLAILLAQAVAGALVVVAVLLIVRWSISRRVDQRSVFASRNRSNSRAATPIPQVDFGTGEFGSQSDQAAVAISKKSNSAFGTTRSIQNNTEDQDKAMSSQSPSDENAIEEAMK